MPSLSGKMPKLCCRNDGTLYATYDGQKYYFGKNRQNAQDAYRRFIAEIVAAGNLKRSKRATITVAELCSAFFVAHPPTQPRYNYTRAAQAMLSLYADTDVNEFGPVALKTVREILVKQTLSRKYVNKLVVSIRTIISWGVGEQLVRPEVLVALKCVKPLFIGQSEAVEHEAIVAVAEDVIEATLPHLPPTLADMVRVQCLTGMRPSEVCEMRLSEVDRSGTPWVYRKRDHKNAWRGKTRNILIGPQARTILESYITEAESDRNDFLFSPIRSENQRLKELRSRRKTKVQPSQVCRKKPQPKRVLREHYDRSGYQHRISLICKKHGIPHWHPNQLRHTAATEIRRDFGLEAAQLILGHTTADVTQIYAERDLERAKKIAEERG